MLFAPSDVCHCARFEFNSHPGKFEFKIDKIPWSIGTGVDIIIKHIYLIIQSDTTYPKRCHIKKHAMRSPGT